MEHFIAPQKNIKKFKMFPQVDKRMVSDYGAAAGQSHSSVMQSALDKRKENKRDFMVDMTKQFLAQAQKNQLRRYKQQGVANYAYPVGESRLVLDI